MSTDRSSSAVRNLRSIFEIKGGENSPDARGRSTNGLTSDKENSRPTSKVRASFVSVEPSGGMAASIEDGVGQGMPGLKRESSAGIRRGSFTENTDESQLELKKTVSQEARRRDEESKVAETIPETAIESTPASADATPSMQAIDGVTEDGINESPLAREDIEPANPDKPATSTEEEPGAMKAAEPSNEEAVSGGAALPPVAEDLRHNSDHENAMPEVKTPSKAGSKSKGAPATEEVGSSSKATKKSPAKPTPISKPSAISTKPSTKPTPSSMKSPSQPKTPTSAKVPSSTKADSPKAQPRKEPVKKASRSSLSAPTAASVARAAGSDRTVSTSSKHSPNARPKPRDTTRPADLSSRLTAPTAASRAKHDSTPAPAHSSSNAVNGRASTTTRPKPQPPSARPTPRSSLQSSHRPESRTSHTARKPAPPPADGSFLERMTRPTAASSSKTHDKVEVKSPPRSNKTTAPPKGKATANGHVKKPTAPAKISSRPSTAKSDTVKPALAALAERTQTNSSQESINDTLIEEIKEVAKEAEPPADGPVTHGNFEKTAKHEEPVAVETFTPQTNGQLDGQQGADGALEATPAAIGSEETIR